MMMRSTNLRLGAKPAVATRRGVAVRAAENKETPPPAGTVFYGGKAYTEAEYAAAAAAGKFETATPATPAPPKPITFGDIMAFSGPGPEIINGRLAQLGFVAALGAEISSDEGVLRQVADEPTGVIAVFLLLIAGSLVPMLSGKKPEAFAMFTPQAEMLNGRAAMIGFAAMLVIETLNNGRALF